MWLTSSFEGVRPVLADVSHAVAQEILRRLGLEGRNVPSALEDFIDCHTGPDRQLTLRLAV